MGQQEEVGSKYFVTCCGRGVWGGNLAVATAVKANIEGWVDAIDGVYAMAPMILGFITSVPVNFYPGEKTRVTRAP